MQISSEIHRTHLLGTASLLLIILVEGFVTIAVEMLTIRQLIPVVGNSVIITSLIIGFFLLFLTLGYYRGGQHTTNFNPILKNNFTIASVLLGIGLSYTFIQYLFQGIYQFISTNSLFALIIYLLFITSPLVYVLGQTVPITTNLFRHEAHIGSISGKVLCISTLGSFLGSVFTTIVLMNFLGVAWTIFINFCLLIMLVIILVDFKQDVIRLFTLFLSAVFIFGLNIGIEKTLFVKTNDYADYRIFQNISYNPPEIGNLLTINNSASSFITQEKKGFEYIELIKRILFQDLRLTHKQILVLGAGGFTLSAQGTYGNDFLYVDIDKDIPNVVKSGFINKINGQFVVSDAKRFLLNAHRKFDVVISDAYSNQHAIPFHLVTREFFQNVKQILSSDGIAIFNIISNPLLRDNYSKRLDNTIRSVFQDCMSIPLIYSNEPTNIIYICKASTKKDTTIYTDNLNKAMLDFFRE